MQIAKGQTRAPNLERLLADPGTLKLFHFGRFDIAVLKQAFGVTTAPVWCTKIASKLIRTFTDRHGLKYLLADLVGVDVPKQQQTSDWGSAELTEAQKEYAASDVLYLHRLKAELEAVNALLGIEQRRHGGAQQATPIAAQAQPQRPRPQLPLADFIIRRLAEGGPMSKDAIQHLTVQEGYFADSDAERGVQAVLLHVVKAGHIRQLPNGDFAEVIRLRRAM